MKAAHPLSRKMQASHTDKHAYNFRRIRDSRKEAS